LSIADYHKELREEMLIQQVQQHEVGAKITITPQEVDDFTRSKSWQAYNNKEYHIEDIIIALPDSPTSQQVQEGKKQADAILDKIHHGMSFRSAAISDSSGNKALQGGDLGWRKLPEIPSAFADQVIHMQANDIGGPLQTPNGFHIIQLAGIRDTGSKQTTSKQIEQLIYQRKLEEQLQTWLAKLRSQAYINMNPEN
jgi:peptidyl-prolyl cis-trans isomerase SurA